MIRCRRLIAFKTRRPPSCFPATLPHLLEVAEQPLHSLPVHRALGLTDGELDAHPRAARARAEPLRAGGLLAPLVGALRLQALGPPPEAASRPRANACCRARVRTRACSTSATARRSAFKVESHNHPSAVEPFQGAATGVGGILRDIIAMGARPIALLDGLRFARRRPALRPRRRRDRRLRQLGRRADRRRRGGLRRRLRRQLPRQRDVRRAPPGRPASRARGATGPGNLVVLYGATTGRDGIGGASVLASQELGEDDADKRPTVQVGDPFTGKKLIEVSVELVESRPRRVAPGLRRRRARLLALRDGAPTTGSTSTSTACRCARRGWSRGRS